MQWHRIKAIMIRNILAERRSIMRLSDFFYWPTLDITLWGLTSTWMSMQHSLDTTTTCAMMTSLVLWQVVVRSSYELSIGAIDELWNRSIINLFSTPLTIYEWTTALMLLGLFKSCVVVLFGASVVWCIYQINILQAGIVLWAAAGLLVLAGWSIGLIGASMIMHWGQKVQSTPWVLAFLFAPVSAVFYPLSVLPAWLGYIALALPTTHVFQAVRAYLFNNNCTPWAAFTTSLCISSITLVCTFMLLIKTFEHSTVRGLARLEQ